MKSLLRPLSFYLVCGAMLLCLGVPVHAETVFPPYIVGMDIVNPKVSYTEGDKIYFNVVFMGKPSVKNAGITFTTENYDAILLAEFVSFDPVAKIALLKALIDETTPSGSWHLNDIFYTDSNGTHKLKFNFDFKKDMLVAVEFKTDKLGENTAPCEPDDFLTYDWIGCVDSKLTVSLTSSTNELYTMVVLPGSPASDVTMTHTGSSSIIIGNWGRFTEGYELNFSAPGVYKLKFVQNRTTETLYYYANITDHEIDSYTEREGLKIGTCKQCNEKVEQFGTPSWRVENKKLVGTEYTTGQVMIALYGENGRLLKVKSCEKGDAKIIDGTTMYRYQAPSFTKAELTQAKQVLCFNFTKQFSPIRDVISISQ